MNWKHANDPAVIVPCCLQQRSELASYFLRYGKRRRLKVVGDAKPLAVAQGAHLLGVLDTGGLVKTDSVSLVKKTLHDVGSELDSVKYLEDWFQKVEIVQDQN